MIELGGILMSIGNDPELGTALEEGYSLIKRADELADQDRQDSSKIRDVGITRVNIAMTCDALGRIPEAIDAYSKCLDICDRLHDIDPDDARIHGYALDSFWHLADLYQFQDDEKNVLATYERAIKFGDNVLKRNPDNALVRAGQAEIRGYYELFRGNLEEAAKAAIDFSAPTRPVPTTGTTRHDNLLESVKA